MKAVLMEYGPTCLDHDVSDDDDYDEDDEEDQKELKAMIATKVEFCCCGCGMNASNSNHWCRGCRLVSISC